MREIELRLPLGLRYSREDIECEANEWIFAFEKQNEILASCQFIVENGRAKMRQVATQKKYQKQGIGMKLYRYCEYYLKEEGIDEIYCHARLSAVSFYKKMGFDIVSNEFIEVGLPHVKMKKKLV